MEEMIPCSVKDQEVFQRVWQRVMAGREDAQCPLETMPPNMQGDLSCDCLDALIRQQGGGFPQECGRQSSCAGCQQPAEEPSMPGCPEPPAEEPSMPEHPEQPGEEPSMPECPEQPGEEPSMPGCPEQPTEEPTMPGWPETPAEEPSEPECPQAPAEPDTLPEADGPHRDNDLPRLWEEPQETTDRTARLRRQVMEALEGWQFYRHLVRRARGTDARVLNGMAGELHRHARKLSAAYFLLTGLRYWPSELLSAPSIPSYWGALRTRHQAEQRQEMAYRTAADDWDDPALLELYGSLIEACQHRSRQLRALLEQDTM